MKKEITVCDICGEHKNTTYHRFKKGEYWAETAREGDRYWYIHNDGVDICSSCMYDILTAWHKGLSATERDKLANDSLRYRLDESRDGPEAV